MFFLRRTSNTATGSEKNRKKQQPKPDRRPSSGKPSETLPAADEHKTSYRVTQIPASYGLEPLRVALIKAFGIDETSELTIHSLASDIDDETSPDWNIATVSFKKIPDQLSPLDSSREDGSGKTIYLDQGSPSHSRKQAVYFDTSFDGFTPLSPIRDKDVSTIDCIVIPGYGGHAFGSFKERGGQFMWLRDDIADLYPRLRIWLYGYKSRLIDETSIESIDDWCHTFCDLLINLRRNSYVAQKQRPLIFIAHSLGGWVCKKAIVSLNRNRDPMAKSIVKSTYGALFFGVPSQGMNVEALATMVGEKPQRATLNLLDERINHRLRAKEHQDFCEAFDFEQSRIIMFFETLTSETVQWDGQRGQWRQNGPRCLLVPPESATSGRRWDRFEDRINLRETHSSMVKFERSNRTDYLRVKERLRELVEEAGEAIQLRFQSKPGTSHIIEEDINLYAVPFSLDELPLLSKFIAREEEMDILRSSLLPPRNRLTRVSQPSRRRVLVLHGLGGAGKTQLALEFARISQGNFSSIFWLDCESRESIRRSLVEVARKIPKGQMLASYQNPSSLSTEQATKIINSVLAWLSQPQNDRWLLVYDDLSRDDSPEARDPLAFDVKTFFPRADHGSILITSRLRKVAQYGSNKYIGRVSQPQGISILQSRIGRSLKDLDKIVELVGGLPLALAHAGAFIHGTAIDVDKYIHFYQNDWSILFDDAKMHQVKDYSYSVISTYARACERVEQIDPDCTMILYLFAYLNYSDLRYSLFKPYISEYGEQRVPGWFFRSFCTELAFTGKMQILLDHSLIEIMFNSSYTVHPIIHRWSLDTAEKADNELSLLAISILNSACSPLHYSSLCGEVTVGPENWKRLSNQCVHLSNLVKSTRLFNQDGQGHILQSCLDLVVCLRKLEKFDEAEAMARQVLLRSKETFRSDQHLIYGANYQLGATFFEQDRFEEAEAMFQQAFEGYEKTMGPDHESTLSSLTGLSSVYYGQGKRESAKGLLQHVLKTREKLLGLGHESTRETIYHLCFLNFSRRKLVQAEALLQRASDFDGEKPGPRLSLFDVFHDRGLDYMSQGRLLDAERTFRRALEGDKEMLGPMHEYSLGTTAKLAEVLKYQGNLVDAERMYRRALEGAEKTLGRDHLKSLPLLHDLGLVLELQGNFEAAERMFRRALRGYEASPWPDDRTTLMTVTELAHSLKHQGNFIDAELMYRRALVACETLLEPDTIEKYLIMHSRGFTLEKLGRIKDAEFMFQRALEGFQKRLVPCHGYVIDTITKLALNFQAQGKMAAAATMLHRALRVSTSKGYQTISQKYEVYIHWCLGCHYSLRGDYAAAKAELRSAVKDFEYRPGEAIHLVFDESGLVGGELREDIASKAQRKLWELEELERKAKKKS